MEALAEADGDVFLPNPSSARRLARGFPVAMQFMRDLIDDSLSSGLSGRNYTS